MKILLHCLLVVAPLLAQSSKLTDDPECIPGVLKMLDHTIAPTEHIQCLFKGLSSTNPKVGLNSAHVVWRFMAALQASGDKKALALYQSILESGYKRQNHWLQRMGYVWGDTPMNEAEQRILQAPTIAAGSAVSQNYRDLNIFKFWGGDETGITMFHHRDTYLASLLPTIRENQEAEIKKLPMSLWPMALIDKDVCAFSRNSRLGLILPEKSLARGAYSLIEHWDNNWRTEACICEQFFLNILDVDKDIQHTPIYIWHILCGRAIHIDWPSFVGWARTMRATSSCEMSYLLDIYFNLNGNLDNIHKCREWSRSVGQEDNEDIQKHNDFLRYLNNMSIIYKHLKGDENRWREFLSWSAIRLQGTRERRIYSITSEFFMFHDFDGDSGRMANFARLCGPYIQWQTPQPSDEALPTLHSLYGDCHMTDDEFRTFLSFVIEMSGGNKDHHCYELWDALEVYSHFNGDQAQIRDFAKVCKPLITSIRAGGEKVGAFEMLRRFKDLIKNHKTNKMQDLVRWMVPYLSYECTGGNLSALVEIYQVCGGDERKIGDFLKWGADVLDVRASVKLEDLNGYPPLPEYWHPFLQRIYISDTERRFVNGILHIIHKTDRNECITFKCSLINELLSVYKGFNGDTQQGKKLIDQCRLSCPNADNSDRKVWLLYKRFADAGLDGDFSNYMSYVTQRYRVYRLSPSLSEHIVFAYGPRSYLRFIRAKSALESEPSDTRALSLFETEIGHHLPPINVQDQHMGHLVQGYANAHSFEDTYMRDYDVLVTMCQNKGYVEQQSQRTWALYSGASSVVPHYQTNTEVDDFVHYIQQGFFGGHTSLLLQILGIEPVSTKTEHFGAYLGRSMLYAKPDTPKADEFLGRAWWLTKKIAEEKTQNMPECAAKVEQDALRKSIGLALLEAVDHSSYGKVSIRCPTRITGEMMKCVCWNLPGSQLRGLIAGRNALAPLQEQNIQDQIASAQLEARQMFLGIHDSGVNLKKLYADDPSPELWRVYQAMFDDFYKRNRHNNGTLIVSEHTLMRDHLGRVVKAFQADGSPRHTPEVVYPQVIFTAIEKAFADLLCQNYEKRRGVAY